MATLYLHLSSYVVSDSTWRPASTAALDQKDGCRKTLYLATGICAMSRKQDNPVLAEKISVTTSTLTSSCLTPQIAPPYHVWGAAEQETSKTPCNTKDELKARIMAVFTNLNKESFRKACRRFWSCLETIVEDNDDFFE